MTGPGRWIPKRQISVNIHNIRALELIAGFLFGNGKENLILAYSSRQAPTALPEALLSPENELQRWLVDCGKELKISVEVHMTHEH